MLRERVRLSGRVKDARLLEQSPETPSDTISMVVRRAQELAFEAGVQQGRALERTESTERLDQAAAAVESSLEEARDALARTAVELATKISRTILKKAIASEDYDLETMVRSTLHDAALGRRPCVVHLNPADYARLADTPFRSGTEIQSDEGVARGDVQVETSLGLLVREAIGSVDAIEERLLEELS